MKQKQKTLSLMLTVLFISIGAMCTAQESEFATPEGIRWGMSQKAVKELKVSNLLGNQQNQLMYYNYEEGVGEIYIFSNDKLIKIQTQKSFSKKKEINQYFNEKIKQLSDLYGNNHNQISANQYVWNYKGTKITLFKMETKKGGLIDIVFQP